MGGGEVARSKYGFWKEGEGGGAMAGRGVGKACSVLKKDGIMF